jgi:hypothetical protein
MVEILAILQLCIQGNWICVRGYESPKIVYQQPKPEDGCYRDKIFYPQCKDLDNPEILYYHNLLRR